MSERMPQIGGSTEKEQKRERLDRLAHELFESREVFRFPGIDAAALTRLREDEQFAMPGYITPIDELIKRLAQEGMRIEKGVSWKEGSNIECVAPASSDGGAYGEDLLHIKNLLITPGMDPRLVELIELSKI